MEGELKVAFFDQLGQKLTQTSQDAVKKTRDMAEVVRLNSAISEETKKVEAAYREIGRLYYEHCAGQNDPVFQTAVAEVERAETSIREMRDAISHLKGIQICPSCGMELGAGTIFCSNCGAKQPEPPAPPVEPVQESAIVCPNCGTEMPMGVSFCTNCGSRLAPPAGDPPQA